MLAMNGRMRNTTSLCIEELEVITGKRQWLTTPDSSFAVDWDDLEPLVLAETRLGVFAEA
jgi:hypothetical protein